MAELFIEWPVWWANVITGVIFVGIAIGVMKVPRNLIYHDAPDDKRWRDIRLWALALIFVQLGVYLVFS